MTIRASWTVHQSSLASTQLLHLLLLGGGNELLLARGPALLPWLARGLCCCCWQPPSRLGCTAQFSCCWRLLCCSHAETCALPGFWPAASSSLPCLLLLLRKVPCRAGACCWCCWGCCSHLYALAEGESRFTASLFCSGCRCLRLPASAGCGLRVRLLPGFMGTASVQPASSCKGAQKMHVAQVHGSGAAGQGNSPRHRRRPANGDQARVAAPP